MGKHMRFGFSLPVLHSFRPTQQPWEDTAGPDDVVRIAQRAEELGYDWVAAPHHMLMVNELLDSMGPRWPEPLTALAFLAGATKRIRLLTHVLVVPYYHPIVLAKMVAVLDHLSKGRLILGIGSGYIEREFQALGVPMRERGARTDEYLRAMKELWTSDTPTFHGKYVSFDHISFEPRPAQRPHPPIWVGGHVPAVLRRAAELGDGWMPFMLSKEELPPKLAYLRSLPAFQKRTRPFDVHAPIKPRQEEEFTHRQVASVEFPRKRDEIVAAIRAIQDVGATSTNVMPVLGPQASVEAFLERMQWFAEEVMPEFR